jgi:hypothetical protein
MFKDWKTLEQEGIFKKNLNSKLYLLGKKVKKRNKEGIIIIDYYENEEPEYFIKYDNKKLYNEKLNDIYGFELWDDDKKCWYEIDKLPIFVLSDEEKKYLNL